MEDVRQFSSSFLANISETAVVKIASSKIEYKNRLAQIDQSHSD